MDRCVGGQRGQHALGPGAHQRVGHDLVEHEHMRGAELVHRERLLDGAICNLAARLARFEGGDDGFEFGHIGQALAVEMAVGEEGE